MDGEQHQAQNCNESDEGEDNYTNACSAFESLCRRDALAQAVSVVCDQGRANANERDDEFCTYDQCEVVHQLALLLASFS